MPPFDNNWTDPERDLFMERVTITASEHTTLGISCSVVCDEFENAFPSDIHQGWKDPRYFALFGMLGLLWEFMEKKNTRLSLPRPLHFMIERQKKFVGNAIELFYAYKNKLDLDHKFADMAHGSSDDYPPLQAADLLAYEATRKLVEEEHDPTAGLRKPFLNLARKGNLVIMPLRERLLEKYVELLREESAGPQPQD